MEKQEKGGNRKVLYIPEDLYERLEFLTEEIGFAHKGEPCIIRFIEAVSLIEPEIINATLEEEQLSPEDLNASFY